MRSVQLADDLIPTIGYIRVSMAREEMISPELQRAAIAQWAARTGHQIIDWVQDLDATGRNFKRKIMRAIERVEASEAQAIAVWKYSRFGRTRTGIEINLARIEQAGGQLLSATEDLDATTATGWFQRDVIFSVATFESKRAGEQWSETHHWRREQGLPATGGRRFGYIWHPRRVYAPDGSVTLQDEHYEPDPESKGLVADLFQGYVAGDGFNVLAARLNAAGIRTSHNKIWNDRSLCIYMDSGFAAGYLRVHDDACKTEPYLSRCPNHHLYRHPTKGHPPIISPELWQQYQERRNFTRTAAPKNRAAAYPLSGLARCGLCSGSTRRVVVHGNSYFICDQRSRKGTTVCVGFRTCPVNVGDEALLRWLKKITGEVSDEARTLSAGRVIPDPAASFERRRAAAQQEVQRIERAVAKHMRTYAMSELDDADGTLEREYLATLAGLRAEKSAAAERLFVLDTPSPEEKAAMSRSAAQPIAIGLLEEWDTLAPGRANALLRKIVGRLEVLPGRRVSVIPAWEVD
ncbi:recombinase family protein [Kitasatospora mediocidica]|uniref:recombinase family protein n=1 Tax=Kitasatospora mediocidica TaxID=58352 RepID=UPI00068C9F79|nr:recombinase family protein [Kitasatospora mediocidica]